MNTHNTDTQTNGDTHDEALAAEMIEFARAEAELRKELAEESNELIDLIREKIAIVKQGRN